MATGYGIDLSCTDKLNTAKLASGKRLLAEACYRRLITWRGTLTGGADEEAYGIDLSSYLGAVGASVAAASLPSIIEAELLKDERVSAVDAALTADVLSDGTSRLTIEILVESVDSDESFQLTLAVSDVTVAILGGIPS